MWPFDPVDRVTAVRPAWRMERVRDRGAVFARPRADAVTEGGAAPHHCRFPLLQHFWDLSEREDLLELQQRVLESYARPRVLVLDVHDVAVFQ